MEERNGEKVENTRKGEKEWGDGREERGKEREADKEGNKEKEENERKGEKINKE